MARITLHTNLKPTREKALELLLKRLEKANDNILGNKLGSGWGRTEQSELMKYSKEVKVHE